MDVAADSSLTLAAISLKKAFIAMVMVKITKKNILHANMIQQHFRHRMAPTRTGMPSFEGQSGNK